MAESYLEFTTCIGCKIGCLKYCPQEIIVNKYEGEKVLSYEKFKYYLSTVPSDVGIIFGGIVEPFQNPDCARMIQFAHGKGHPIELLTTLTGLKYSDAVPMADIPFTRVVIHLPDPLGNAKIPFTEDYQKCLPFFLKTFKNLTVMKMDEKFVTNCVEEMHRGTAQVLNPGRVMCDYHKTSIYYAMPSGKVYYCCMMRGVEGYVGDLETEPYSALIGRFKELGLRYQSAPDSMCHICTFGKPYWKYRLVEAKNKYFGEKPLISYLLGRM